MKKNGKPLLGVGDRFRFTRKKLISYYFDFECGNSIFSELIDEADAQLFLEQITEFVIFLLAHSGSPRHPERFLQG